MLEKLKNAFRLFRDTRDYKVYEEKCACYYLAYSALGDHKKAMDTLKRCRNRNTFLDNVKMLLDALEKAYLENLVDSYEEFVKTRRYLKHLRNEAIRHPFIWWMVYVLRF